MSARNSVGATGKVIDMKFPQKDKYLIFSNEKCFFGDGNFLCSFVNNDNSAVSRVLASVDATWSNVLTYIFLFQNIKITSL